MKTTVDLNVYRDFVSTMSDADIFHWNLSECFVTIAWQDTTNRHMTKVSTF